MREDRLLILAAHLEFGMLGHEVFDFKVFNQNINNKPVKVGECGTKGCALGECPIIWPEYWKFKYAPVLKNLNFDADDHRATIQSAVSFFDITIYEVEVLFLPIHTLFPLEIGGKKIGLPKLSASRYEVAKHIKRFVELKLNEA